MHQILLQRYKKKMTFANYFSQIDEFFFNLAEFGGLNQKLQWTYHVKNCQKYYKIDNRQKTKDNSRKSKVESRKHYDGHVGVAISVDGYGLWQNPAR